MDRLVLRARGLVLQLAICSLRGVDRRLLITFWHLADRWGRVTNAGVKLPLPLTHDLLAAAVGARRPTVSTALACLRERGQVERCDGNKWLLKGDPPLELRRLEESTAGAAS
jgi:CRP/FNR family cyclic AMP-dependent transcriptional regulator